MKDISKTGNISSLVTGETARFISLNEKLSASNTTAQYWQKIQAPFFTMNNTLYTADKESIDYKKIEAQGASFKLYDNTYIVRISDIQLPLLDKAQAIDITPTQPSILWAHIGQSFALTQSEMRVMYWTAIGCKASDIATKTGYTTSTVHTYQKHLYEKLGITRQNQLTAFLWLHS